MENDKKYLIVEEDKSLRRDPHSNAIINFDNSAYIKHMKKVRKLERQDEEIEVLRSELKEIKELLNKILESK